ncbi:unnamed protein product [Adineta ricciae]|uniref:Uncharacterized protein n=1 Tax=Adineta ricciae TaxID=249248 RepID=A0A813NGA9_ADIRI|nr:unnamed protein product [Adineta ricciae]
MSNDLTLNYDSSGRYCTTIEHKHIDVGYSKNNRKHFSHSTTSKLREIMLRMLHTTSGRKNFDKVSVDPPKDKQDKLTSTTNATEVEAKTKDAINSAVQSQPPIDSADTKKT